jgi:hypothetical protein
VRLEYDEMTGMTVPQAWLKYDLTRLEEMITNTQELSAQSNSAVIDWAHKRIKALKLQEILNPN